ncbi:MAG: outer membrane protein transport protein [Steroidobacteraceae bacterium]
MKLRNAAIGCAVLGAFASASAWGSGFYLLEQNASGLGRAFAGTAAIADDASTVFFNPAGLARLEGVQVMAVASGININTRFHDSASVAALGQPLGGSGGNAGGLSIVPALYLSVPFADSFTFGLGVNAPFGLKTDYDPGWAGRFQALRSEVKTINVNPSLAWAPTPHVSVGVGLSYQRIQATLTSAVNYSAVVYQGAFQSALGGGATPQQAAAAAGALLAATGPLEGATRVEGDDTAWGYNFGVLFDVGDATRVGLAYRSAIKYGVSGTVGFQAPTTAVPTAALIIQVASGSLLADGPVGLSLKLPDSATASLVQKLGDRATLSFDASWTGWSSVPELQIVRASGTVLSTTPEKWKDSWRFALGSDCRVADHWTVRVGVARDQAPVPDSTRTPRLPDNDRTWLALGAAWSPSDAVKVDVGYAHLFVKDAPLNQNAGSAPSYGTLVGAQKTKIDILAAQLSVKF